MITSAANSRLISDHGTPRQVELFAVPQHEGRALGTMCLSEPDAGSSLGDIVTRATADGEDDAGSRYRITGRKMWISAGDQNVTGGIVHLVLAKIAGEDGVLPPGSKGISLFIVPNRLPDGVDNDITVIGLNHKMGYRGTPNCAFNFGDGRVNAFSMDGDFLGALRDAHGDAVTIDGLWGLQFGNGVAGTPDTLFFSAGPDDEAHGLLGTITLAG